MVILSPDADPLVVRIMDYNSRYLSCQVQSKMGHSAAVWDSSAARLAYMEDRSLNGGMSLGKNFCLIVVRQFKGRTNNSALSGVVFQPFEEVKKAELEIPITPQVLLARQKYEDKCEAAINEQINVEYNVSYVYHSLCAYFDRDNVALKGLAKNSETRPSSDFL
ncbi:Ferritin [Corchorus olitorius]|uniref:Ferritin n=1 Tax=Corchorus olitorius TaxID=93759 RepID=A0A1R3JEF6_9ROSI|nr:Ferritin [Corchorus olitorius]